MILSGILEFRGTFEVNSVTKYKFHDKVGDSAESNTKKTNEYHQQYSLTYRAKCLFLQN